MEKEKEAHDMSEEIAQAVDFYVNHLARLPKPQTSTDKDKESKEKDFTPLTELDSTTLETFREELSRLLEEKYQGHWYPEDKLRGSGFRSISYDTRMDVVFTKAASKAVIDRLPERFENVRYYIMFVNPGEVKLKNTRLHTSEAKFIWRSGGIIEDEEEIIPGSPTLTVDLKSESNKESSSPSSISPSSSSPPSSLSSDESPRHSSPSRGLTRVSSEFKDRPSSTTPYAHVRHRQGPRKLSPTRFSSAEGTTSPPTQRSPSPPPLSLDQYGQQGSAFPHSQNFHSPGLFRMREPSHPLPENPYIHGPMYNLPLRNGTGPTFPAYTPNKYAFTAPRSRTPSPPLLVGATPAPQMGGFFPRSHTTPVRPASSIPFPQNHHELPRPHLQHPPHDYTRFIPRYRSMVHTRS